MSTTIIGRFAVSFASDPVEEKVEITTVSKTDEPADVDPGKPINVASIHDLFNGYAYGAYILDLRDYDDYLKSHIHTAIHVDTANLRSALSTYFQMKKIMCYDYSRTCADRKKYQQLYEFCVQYKDCEEFHVSDASFVYEEFEATYPFLCKPHNEKQAESKLHRVKYPNVIIANQLYLGDMWNRQSTQYLKQCGITHIVDATQDQFKNDQEFKVLKVPLSDTPIAPIEEYFASATKFIDNALECQENRVFVHCQMGISRSSTIVLAYLMKSRGYSLYDAYKLAQGCRPRIRPNDGFFYRLGKYEMTVLGTSTTAKIEKEGLRNLHYGDCLVM